MDVVRKWVFPILRLVLVALVAVALGKLAFFPDGPAEAGPEKPTGQVTEPQVTVTTATISNDVTLKGTVTSDPAVPIRATNAGTVDELAVTVGQAVSAGDRILDIKIETQRDPIASTGPDGLVTTTPRKPVITYVVVTAPITGIVSALPVLADQTLSVGDIVGRIAPPSFSVTGALAPAQQYRLVSKPTEATVTIAGGPAPFTCTGLTIVTPLAGAEPGNTSVDTSSGASGVGAVGGASSGGMSTVTCAVPPEVTVFGGLPADVSIAAGKAENVLSIPTTAVQGTAGTGNVWVVTPDGTHETRPVTLGITNGHEVQVSSGLVAGDSILQFVPGAPEPNACEGTPGCSPTTSVPTAG
ncbi:efflux RND transporter periplasmic adaptor subunit [Cryobacterium algoricola]|uniref:Efflux RND transporter periplasmic adaptor subunit n=1 Tax=Cryobacterium algoricola TaxID=1259183 RepID=A0ABY2IDX9_9MICO|nr:efflux RND transporter periplasmic adaptor subunit [Cryobacterium algoricola]TFB86852.1 efflux RND transporter periplasmic adaptor subunit [Cryobacterium algoricola]